MNPNNSSQSGGALGPAGPQPPHQPSTTQDSQTAAANLLRTQIDALYGDRAVATPAREGVNPRERTTPYTAQSTEDTNPYERTHSDHPQPQAEQWKAYHTAWQDYYQKYYSAYYAHQQAQQAQAAEQQRAAAEASSSPATQPAPAASQGYFTHQPEPEETAHEISTDVSKDEALFELRQKLLGKVRTQATKIRKSRHFVPIVAALAVVLIFAFLQYNRVLIATVNAYVSPGAINPQDIVVDPTADTNVSSDPRLVIPKINVDVPALYDVGSDYNSQMAAMQKGVAHFAIPGANSHPGEVGNTVLSGHSSNDLFDPGDYKFIFAQLDKLVPGDTIYANYNGKRYTYVVTKTNVVQPTDVSALIYPTNKPILTLITCTPLGTSLNRLLVTAEQVSPDPANANAAPAGSGQTSSGDSGTAIPGSSPTLIERLFGAH